MDWGTQQSAAINAVGKWLADGSSPQIFRLFGYAGTGKTTLAKHIASHAKSAVFAAYTGKAALMLRKRGCDGASTIHSLIYKPIRDKETGQFEFVLNHDSPAGNADLIVVDEVSMVGEELANDLLSFGTKILVLGDPEQLPPVKGEGFFINAKPDAMLTDIRRQAEENPIIRMSMDIRSGKRLTCGAYGDSLVLSSATTEKERLRELVLGADQLICGLNKTRHSFNSRIRQLKGLSGGGDKRWMPVPSDRLVCLRNNKDLNIFNGGLWDVQSVKERAKTLDIRVASADEPERDPIDISVPFQFFCGREGELNWREKADHQEFCFGWALTCHKSQGSQWDSVIAFDESRVFREDAKKWLYTAVTRAAEKITVVL